MPRRKLKLIQKRPAGQVEENKKAESTKRLSLHVCAVTPDNHERAAKIGIKEIVTCHFTLQTDPCLLLNP